MDKQNLSKYKWIYRVYLNDTNEWHIEKYPIVYINKTFVYYKAERKNKLNIIEIRVVYDTFEELGKWIAEVSYNARLYMSRERFFATFSENEDNNFVREIRWFLKGLNTEETKRVRENYKLNGIRGIQKALNEFEMYKKQIMSYGVTEEDFK